MLQSHSSKLRVALLVVVTILAVVIAVGVAEWWPLSGGEEEVLWGYVEVAEPKRILA